MDEDISCLEQMQDLLLDRYEVAVAEDTVAATDLLLTEHFDLLMLEPHLPVVNGFVYLERLAQIPQFRDLPILIFSDTPAGEAQFKLVPPRAYLAKPLQFEQLLQQIQALLKATPSSSAIR